MNKSTPPTPSKDGKITIIKRSVLIDKFKSAKQQTLTQLFAGHPESSSAEDSTDDDAFVTPSKIKRTHDKYSLVTPPSAKKKRENKQLGEPAREGDLVTSTAAELNHPRLLFGDIGEGYIFFGIVLEGDQTALKVSWSSVELGHQKARVIKKKGDKPGDFFKDIEWVSRRLVRAVARYNSGNLNRLNHFVKAAISAEFCFVKNVGWKRIHS